MDLQSIWDDYLSENIWLVIGIIGGAILVIVGLVNYFRAFREVKNGGVGSTGSGSSGSSSAGTTPPPPPKPKRSTSSSTKRLISGKALFWSIFLCWLPVALQYLPVVLNIQLADILPLELLFGSGSDSQLEYEFSMMLVDIAMIMAAILGFIAAFRVAKRKGCGFWGKAGWLFLMYIIEGAVFRISGILADGIFGTYEATHMVSCWMGHIILLIWRKIDIKSH